MKWLRLQVVVLALAVFATSAECLMACATDLCPDTKSATTDLPPCHKHHPPKQDNERHRGCAHPIFVAEGRAVSVVNPEPAPLFRVAALPIENVSSTPPPHPGALLQQGTSPPASTNPYGFAVLRI